MLFDPLGQLWAIIEGAALLPGINHCAFINFESKNHWEPRNMIGFLIPAEYLVDFESMVFQFDHTALTNQDIPANHLQSIIFRNIFICIEE